MKKYLQIYQLLQQEIIEEKYPIGHFLPSEQELTLRFKVSRDTIRKALQNLQEEGLIEKVRGQGSKVLQKKQVHFPISQLTSYQEIVQKSGLNSQTKVISLDKVMIDQKLSHITGFSEHRIVWKVTRLRTVNDHAAVLDMDYLDMGIVPNLTVDIAAHSIYSYLEDTLKLSIDYAKKEITIERASNQDKILLDLGKDRHVVSVSSQVFLEDGRQFQFTESRHKLEQFRFVDYAKRNKKGKEDS